ncbi:hypothetical protein Pla175_06590 [Pirellulimonas nuda]|uniref:SpoVT-AbrB domain-containing protein n=1 Tax=Pirellulimonas nuda TaxID=2528009 RepID=A0A518D744_9BACT|nr:AbrB/MazE/SpoVT family DNA-binding domain-containing protein [Pirellulimonas nuda]QDU87300.1 hypothetical protein Pla175_06590 [Pirellulimonas nuda]
MTMLKVTTIDNQLAVVLSPELAAHLNASAGDELLTEVGSNGRILIFSKPIVDSQVKVLNEVMDRRKDALGRLAE